MATLLGAHRVRAADILRPRRQGVVRALAVDAPDRMDRRKIQHVEAHLANARQMALDIAEGAVPMRVVRHRTREHLVPAGESGAGALRIDRHLVRGDQMRTVVGHIHQRREVRRQQQIALRGLAVLLACGLLARRLYLRQQAGEFGRGSTAALRRRPYQGLPLDQLQARSARRRRTSRRARGDSWRTCRATPPPGSGAGHARPAGSSPPTGRCRAGACAPPASRSRRACPGSATAGLPTGCRGRRRSRRPRHRPARRRCA